MRPLCDGSGEASSCGLWFADFPRCYEREMRIVHSSVEGHWQTANAALWYDVHHYPVSRLTLLRRSHSHWATSLKGYDLLFREGRQLRKPESGNKPCSRTPATMNPVPDFLPPFDLTGVKKRLTEETHGLRVPFPNDDEFEQRLDLVLAHLGVALQSLSFGCLPQFVKSE